MKDIIIDDLTKGYGDQTILNGLSLVIPSGQTTFIQGKSGCGKTTLCRCIAGLESYQGHIDSDQRMKVSVIFQEDRLVPSLSIYKNLWMVKPKDDHDFDQRIHDGLKVFGLVQDQHKRIDQCSGGMARRVAILRSLIVPFDVLIADEALKGMDGTTMDQVMAYLINITHGKTIIWVSHDPREIHYFNDVHIIDMDKKSPSSPQ